MNKENGELTLTIIGYLGKYPNAEHATSCYLLQGAGRNIVVDMGSGALLKLVRFIEPKAIDTIILTHLHGDHMADIFAYKNIALEREGLPKVRLIAPQTPNKVLDAILEGDLFDYQPLVDNSFMVGDISCHPYKMVHPVECYGIRAQYGRSILAYTADTLYNDNLIPLLNGASLVLGDACILDKEFDKDSKHISVKDISTLTSGTTLILTHLFDGKQEEILAEALLYNTKATLAREGLKIKI